MLNVIIEYTLSFTQNVLKILGGGEQTTEVMNGEVNGQGDKDDTTTQTATTQPVNGVQQQDAGEYIK